MNVIKEKTDISIKICGISDIKTIKHCLNIGINWLGFVFFEKSPRHISFEKAIKFRKYIVKSNILNNSKIVALSVDATNSYLDKINETLNPDMFQLHGNETPSRCKFIKERYKKKVMKVIKVNDKNDIILSSKFNNDVDWLLFDSEEKQSLLPGGNGKVFDWSLFKNCSIKLPWMLAGGLTTKNVKTAIQLSGTCCVDLSSGVEIKRGEKDNYKITSFLNEIKNY